MLCQLCGLSCVQRTTYIPGQTFIYLETSGRNENKLIDSGRESRPVNVAKHEGVSITISTCILLVVQIRISIKLLFVNIYFKGPLNCLHVFIDKLTILYLIIR